jgi:hypothetical protein
VSLQKVSGATSASISSGSILSVMSGVGFHVLIFHITQTLGIDFLNQIPCFSDVQNVQHPQEKWDIYQTLHVLPRFQNRTFHCDTAIIHPT